MADQMGMADIRGENVERAVKGFALMNYKLQQVLLVSKSNNWTETYYRETAADLTAAGETFDVEGVARGASFPHVEPSWTKVQGQHVKFAAEGLVFLEDKLTDAIDVQARTLLRVGRAIAKAKDEYIYTQLTNASGINTAAAVAPWNDATIANRDPIRDILTGIQYMAVDNYDALQNGYLLLSPLDYTNLMMNSKVVNNPSFKTADVVSNGVVGQICGLKIIVTTAVAADEAMIIIGKRAATWKTAVGMTSKVKEDEGIKYIIRAWEIGHVQVTDPEAIHVITNTQA